MSTNKASAGESRRGEYDAEVIIIGAGVVGCATAVALGQKGRKVILLERNLKEPDRIVGELLQPGGVQALEQLGIEDCLENIDSIPVKGYEVIYLGQRVHIPYEYPGVISTKPGEDKDLLVDDDTPKPEGRSFHHGRFIQNLRAAARKIPSVTLIEATAKEMITAQDSNQVVGVIANKDEKEVAYHAPITIISDGHSSKFRSRYIDKTPVAKSRFWGLILHDVDLPQPEHGHVVIGKGGPILLYQISSSETRILVDVPKGAGTSEEGGTKAFIRRHVLDSIPESVQPMFEKAFEKGGWKCMPNEFLPSSQNRTPGLIILGDAMNIRHPLTGGGMTVAINDAVLIGDLLSPENVRDLADTDTVLRQMRTFHWERKKLDSVINILAQALYSLFAADDPHLRALQRGCFAYFQYGSNCINGPVGLLAGILRRPIVLIYHFFLVALLSMWLNLRDSKVWFMPFAALQNFVIFGKACQVLFPYLIAEVQI